jgi:hypothetical protein
MKDFLQKKYGDLKFKNYDDLRLRFRKLGMS